MSRFKQWSWKSSFAFTIFVHATGIVVFISFFFIRVVSATIVNIRAKYQIINSVSELAMPKVKIFASPESPSKTVVFERRRRFGSVSTRNGCYGKMSLSGTQRSSATARPSPSRWLRSWCRVVYRQKPVRHCGAPSVAGALM